MAGKPKSRCRFTNGRGRCRFPSSRGHAFCPAHAKQVERDQPLSSAEAAEILGPMEEFQSADDVNYALGQLFSLAARRQIRTRDAAILTYMCQLILQTLKPEPHPRRPPHVIVDNAAPYRAALAAKEAARKAKQEAEAQAAAAAKEEAERQAEAQAASERKAREEAQARAQAAAAEAARVNPLADSAQYQGPRDQKPGQINDLSQWRTYRGVLR